jgi:anti-sigma B factor antagonist
MKLSYEDHDTITVMTISGALTADQTSAFRRACEERFTAGIRDIVLDIEFLSVVDSAGLEQLLWLIEEVADRDGHVKLVKPDELVQKVLKVTRLEKRFDIHNSVESAAKSLR